MSSFVIKRHDRLPFLDATLSDEGGTLTTLAGATVVFVMKNAKTGRNVLRKSATVLDAALLKVRYEWEAEDTAIAGKYNGEFEVSFGGLPWTFPSPGYIPIQIVPDCD